jgi:hypothetical protein
LLSALTLALSLAHAAAILQACGGPAALTNPWPIPTHDHPIQFHSSTLAPTFFAQSGTNAGYDPSFMAGYPKSILFPPSSTLFDVAALLTAGRWPAPTYKITVFLAVAAFPFLTWLAAHRLGLSPLARFATVLLGLLYVWTNGGEGGFPLNYARYGMVPYFLAIPLGLAWLGQFVRFVQQGGIVRGLTTTLFGALVWMVHITTPLVLAPAAACGYLSACRHRRPDGLPCLTRGRHLAIAAMPVIIIALNAFWWWPGLLLRSERGDSGFALANREPVLERLTDVVAVAPPIQVVLYGLALLGALQLFRRQPITTWALGGLLAAGVFWGYLAGFFRSLDFLQPGRHTYALHLAACLYAGAGLSSILASEDHPTSSARIVRTLAVGLIGARLFAPDLLENLSLRLGTPNRPGFLACRPPERLIWIIDQIKRSMKPGERLLYEESGFDLPDEPDPYDGGRFSGLLPWFTGVELLGGPYLHVALRSNFTQFGEGRLFGQENWTEAHFRRYAEIYRPSAILCWSRHARAFCEAHPELIEILARHEQPVLRVDLRTGRAFTQTTQLIFGRVKGYEGSTARGSAEVQARPGQLWVRRPPGARLDAPAVLRYHYVPGLTGRPPIPLQPVWLGADPVPLIALTPPAEAASLELSFRPTPNADPPAPPP